MSRVGKHPIELPDGVTVQQSDSEVVTKGPKGELRSPLPDGIEMKQEGTTICLVRQAETTQLKALHGTARSLLHNNVVGVIKGWESQLELIGVGYRAQLKGKELVFALGYSHDVKYSLPDGVSARVTDQTKVSLSCIDKQKLGQVAAQIRLLRPPEPYKGKGICYSGEIIRRKAGKSGKAAKT